MDYLIGAAALFLLVCAIGYGGNFSSDRIIKQCDKIGAFVVGEIVYECKAKP